MITIKNLIIGIVSSVIVALILGVLSSWKVAMKVNGGVGLISWLIAGVFSGAFVSGDRMRANNYIETTEDNRAKNKVTSILLIFGIPFLITALTIYLITK